MVKQAQALLRGLDGRTWCLSFGARVRVPCREVLSVVAAACALPDGAFLLVTGAGVVSSGSADLVACDGLLPSLSLLLPLCGGKGGFGSLLRGAGKGGRLTANDDACRDLSGRRLRDANAEAKLKEWMAGAKERQLEAVAEAHIKAQSASATQAGDGAREEEALARQHAQIVSRTGGAVQKGLLEAQKLAQQGKRKQQAQQELAQLAGKRRCMWALPCEAEEEEPSEDEGEGKPQPLPECQAAPAEPQAAAQSAAVESAAVERMPEPAEAPSAAPVAAPVAPVDLGAFGCASELEALGLEALKVELSARGLKCGGTLQERAQRLFLLKTHALEQLDAKHRAKSMK